MSEPEEKQENFLHELFMCSRCEKNLSEYPHTCPFASDIYDDNETLCDCCDDCTQQCADDI
jgi:hypothetical protein